MPRDRGRFLNDKGCNKIWQAIQVKFPDGYTLARLLEQTDPQINPKAGKLLSEDTISNIINRRAKSDRSSIEALFQAFGLTVEADDLTPDPPIIPTLPIDPNFVGREDAIAHIDNLIARSERCILIWGSGGVGKSCLAKKYCDEKLGWKRLEFDVGKRAEEITSVKTWIQAILPQLGEESGRDFLASLECLKQKLQNQPVCICIENLEIVLNGSGQFLEKYRDDFFRLLSILTDPKVRSITLLTSRERLQENLNITSYKLPKLSSEVWQEFWRYKGIDTDVETIEPIHAAYGGNALAMKVLCDPIQEDFKGNVTTYWRERKTEYGLLVETAVGNLIEEQFNRLQNVCSDVYKLLCRMGCYRYQDVPTVPKEGLLCLLWDVQKRQKHKVVMALHDRALVDFENGGYKLHPIVREEAIDRLRDSDDWEKANCSAAEFWTESVETVETVGDALTAFEAFHHYMEIDDKQKAADVIVKPRDNKWEEGEPLGCAFYRTGLLQLMFLSINSIIDDINLGYPLSRMYNVLGDLYWLLGDIRKAIEKHKSSENIVNKVLDRTKGTETEHIFCLELVEIKTVSFFNIGLCKIDQGEIKEAIKFLEKCEKLAKENQCLFQNHNIEELKSYEFDCWYTLAFCYSCLGISDRSYNFLNKFNQNLDNIVLNAWGKGYSFLFLGLTYKNLADIEKAFEMYKRAISYAEDSHYPQVKAKALTGLAELYRIQNDFETAFTHHVESIAILEKIGAKCDLAEAYYQRGLTYQAMGELECSTKDFDRAIDLWEKIGAPKQVIRVQQSRNNPELS